MTAIENVKKEIENVKERQEIEDVKRKTERSNKLMDAKECNACFICFRYKIHCILVVFK